MTRIESDNIFLSEPYRYAMIMANIVAPEYECDDETGETYQVFSHVGFDLFYKIQQGKCRFYFTKEDYDSNDEIQQGLSALGIDIDAFWHALVFLDAYSYDKFSHAHKFSNTEKEMVDSFITVLESEGASIVAKSGSSKYEVNDPGLVSFIRECMASIRDKVDDSMRRVELSDMTNKSFSERISFEAQCLIELIRRITDGQLKKDGKSFKKPLLLVSRLLYFSGVANNESYLVSSDTLKGILKSYPNPGESFVGNFI